MQSIIIGDGDTTLNKIWFLPSLSSHSNRETHTMKYKQIKLRQSAIGKSNSIMGPISCILTNISRVIITNISREVLNELGKNVIFAC